MKGNCAYIWALMAGFLHLLFLVMKAASLPRNSDLNSLTWKAFCVVPSPSLRPSQASCISDLHFPGW